ncbi:MAG: hypothetical protein GMKNLPBB_01909 [Myxococcota bacterium]|nr:hypothetical protein [Myxococcota bacterium]
MKNLSILIPAVALAGLSLVVGACSGAKPVDRDAQLDTPEHHRSTADDAFMKNDLEQAQKSLERAKARNPEYGPAYSGLGLVAAMKNDFKAANDLLDEGVSKAEKPAEKEIAHTDGIRIASLERKGDDWIEKAEKHFRKAIDNNKDSPEAHYFMGVAYKRFYNFKKAGEMFSRVKEIGKTWTKEAESEWKLVQKIERAAPGTRIGKEIALVESISRADLAALLVEEFRLEKVLERAEKKEDKPQSFKAPGQGSSNSYESGIPPDVESHSLAADIKIALKYKVRGLQPEDSNAFRPTEAVTRAAFALVAEDLVVRVNNDQSLASKFLGSASPFKDVPASHWAFNAAMTCTTRNIMEADVDGNFNPTQPVSGADALLFIQRLKESLKLYN